MPSFEQALPEAMMEDVSSRTVGFSARILPEPQHVPSHDLPTASLRLKPNPQHQCQHNNETYQQYLSI